MTIEETPETQYCSGCRQCTSTVSHNFYEYLWLYCVAYPVMESESALHHKEFDVCNCFCTTLCLPIKCVMLLPFCPCLTFCPKCVGFNSQDDEN